MYRFVRSSQTPVNGGILDWITKMFNTILNGLNQAGFDYEEDTVRTKRAEQKEKQDAQQEGRRPSKIVTKFYVLHLLDNNENEHDARLAVSPSDDNKVWATLEFDDGKIIRTSKPKTSDEIDEWIVNRCDDHGYTWEDREEAGEADVTVQQR